MITRVRETEDGYVVIVSSADGEAERRETPNLAEAFAWQTYASVHGTLPIVPKADPTPKGKKK